MAERNEHSGGIMLSSATFVGTAYSQALSDEIDTLGAHDILFVTAAGNTGDNNDDPAVRRYPCGYDRPTEICATASDQYDQKPHWANCGATTVDLAPRGRMSYSTLRNGSYGYISGGSMASPQVAGTAALVLARLYVGSQPARRHPRQRRSASVPQWTRPHRRPPGRVQGPSGMLEFPAAAAGGPGEFVGAGGFGCGSGGSGVVGEHGFLVGEPVVLCLSVGSV